MPSDLSAPPRHGLRDTPEAVENLHAEMLRRAGPAARKRLWRALTRRAFDLAYRAIRRRHPHATKQEIGLRFVAIHYGEDLARRVERALAMRR